MCLLLAQGSNPLGQERTRRACRGRPAGPLQCATARFIVHARAAPISPHWQASAGAMPDRRLLSLEAQERRLGLGITVRRRVRQNSRSPEDAA